jgi:type II secretory ATPase GspE/PulE/Tfp pilus assembly ATPase PilB-like protein
MNAPKVQNRKSGADANAEVAARAQGAAKRHIGQILIAKGILTEDQLRIALLEQLKTQKPVGRLLVSLGFVSEAILRDALSEKLGLISVDLNSIVIDGAALGLIPREFAKRHNIFPIALDRSRQRLIIGLADSNNVVALDQLRARLRGHYEIELRLAGETEIIRAIEQYYGHELSIDGILHEIETGEIDYQSLQSSEDAYSQPVVRLIAALLADAVERDASDIHFEPEQNFLRIRYRVDGVLRQIRSLHRTYWPAMAVRIKVMAKMNIAETRAPQDGRISLTLAGKQIDFRVASQATSHGENIVLRILDREKGIVPLSSLGLEDTQLTLLKKMIARPEGIILVTGPTGSGKTTTLYSILSHINNDGINIMTLEDPVEYPMTLIRQTSINEVAKMDFANGIRSLMRQDPDVILVGEVRDEDTATMAFRAAMTGHQVYSTLHTNSAVGVIPRLLDIGIVPDVLAGNIIGVIAQRLIRVLCKHCRSPQTPSYSELRLLGLNTGSEAESEITHTKTEKIVYHPVGCELCDYQGYRGRVAIMELLKIDADLDDLITRRATARELTKAAQKHGFRTLAEDGVRRVLDGTTSLQEVLRVVDLTERM